jgi:hypothetical protein
MVYLPETDNTQSEQTEYILSLGLKSF